MSRLETTGAIEVVIGGDGRKYPIFVCFVYIQGPYFFFLISDPTMASCPIVPVLFYIPQLYPAIGASSTSPLFFQ